MASEILQSLVERVHLLQERPGSWADQDRHQAIMELTLELVQSLAELEDRLRRVEARPQAAGSSARKPSGKSKAPAKTKAKPAAKPKAKSKAKSAAKAKAKPAPKAKARGKKRR